MSNQRSVMTEFRFLDQKRQAEGLSAEEAARYAQLRDLVGPETAGPPRSGFDVNAAAARLRESLLPAGLRGRPPEPPPAAAPEPAPLPAPAPEALALEQAWAEAPFADLSPEPADPLFDPGSLAQEVRPQAWNPEAPGYDPNAPYDEAAWIAAGYDPNATYDWSAYGYGPDGQPLAAGADAAVAAGSEGAEGPPQAEDQPVFVADEEAAPFAEPLQGTPVEVEEPELTGFEVEAPSALQAWEPGLAEAGAPVEAAPVEEPPFAAEPAPLEGVPVEGPIDDFGTIEEAPAEAMPGAAAEPAWDGLLEEAAPAPSPEPPPEAAPAQAWAEPAPEPDLLSLGEVELSPELEPEAAPQAPEPEALPFDPNAPFDHAKWFGRGAAAAPEPGPAPEAVPADAGLDFELTAEPAAPAFGEYDETATAPAPLLDPLDLSLGELPPAAPVEGAAEAPLAATDPTEVEPLDLGAPLATPAADDAAGWLGDPPPASHLPAPADAPFGDYDEAAAPLAGAPALAADGALEAMLPFDPAAASAIEPGAVPEGYEPGGPSLDPATLPPADGAYDDAAAFSSDQMYGGPEGDALPGGAPLELGAGLPDWQPEAALEQGFELASNGSFGHPEVLPVMRTPAWGTAVAAPTEGWESAPALDLAAPFEAEAPAEAAAALEPEELPTLDGADLLEELPAEAAPPALELAFPAPEAPAAELTSLDGAFEQEAAVEAAAYPPPDADAPAEAEPLGDAFPLRDAEPMAEPAAEAEPAPAFEAPAAAPPAFEPFADAAPALAQAAAPVDLGALHEPEPALSYEAAAEALPPEIAAAYAEPAAPAAAFEPPPAVAGLFDDLGAPEPILEPEPLPAAGAPGVSVPGSHRVVLHTVDGQVKRGLLVDALLDAPLLPLQPQGPGAPEELPTDAIKAIFFMLAPGEKAPSPEGKKVRVTFRDGRQVAGFSPDYQEGLVGFFMIPADTRTNTGRIWVYQSAVKSVAVS